ncbi:hypothetical protein F8568_016420 [Actinomadura sp. LD22]|uniref:HNH nuclease domain-containing protein n=1 Tax=Actinomadura physcomitrii TaxID=2650748 RepID=A0A6I4M707_9ACTN|nr:HNH endonuclease [Actinomadura physcomitrii]MWA01928.1 hypothetical protein [Actinomadura physcomitrii]
MPASERTRRELFERGGGRCAMCGRSLVIDAGPGGTGYNIAEAAHIVAEKDGGPRGAGDRPADVNGIANLVLLCPSHHRTIDKGDGERLWPRHKLLQLKRDHESWTAVLAARPTPPEPQARGREGPPGPGDVVVVDGEPYRICAEPGPHRDAVEHAERAYEAVTCDGGAVRCQGHVYGEGRTEGHAWLRLWWTRHGAGPSNSARTMAADEMALLADLPALPALPRLLGVEMTERTVAVVTAMPAPTTARDRLTRTGAVPGRDELALLAGALPDLCEALGELHDRGLAHGALSGGTILMPAPGALALRDLGLAAAGRPAAGAADVRQLARILYELITGRPAGRRHRHVAPSVLNPAAGAGWDAMLLRALSADAAERPGARAFAAGLGDG